MKNLNPSTLQPLISWYIQRETWLDLERYKWEAFRQFNLFFYSNDPIADRIDKAFSRANNLLDSKQYFPLGMFKEVIPENPQLLDLLYDDLQPIIQRIGMYQKGFDVAVKKMTSEGIREWDKKKVVSSYQDAHAVSVYLAMRFPDKYYIYKYGIFRDFAKILGYRIEHSDPTERMLEFFELCGEVKKELVKYKEFIAYYKQWLKDQTYSDPTLNLLTQDFIYSVVRHREQYEHTSTVIAVEAKDLVSTIKKNTVVKAGKKIDFIKRDERNRGLGKEGELWVLNYEKERTKGNNVVHISEEQGDGAGYDILSVEDDGVTPRYIEVKTTTGGIDTPFFFSNNELQFSIANKEHYYIYRLYDFGNNNNLAIIHGGLDEIDAQPVSYKCIVNKGTR